tara:strand:+ start:758 stop:2077 length:1320 start_codon:yes stop_codon:yes gene_type:complete
MDDTVSTIGWEVIAVTAGIFFLILLVIRFAMGDAYGDVDSNFGGGGSPPPGQNPFGERQIVTRTIVEHQGEHFSVPTSMGKTREGKKKVLNPAEEKWDEELESLIGKKVRNPGDDLADFFESEISKGTALDSEDDTESPHQSEAEFELEFNSELKEDLKSKLKEELKAEIKTELESELKIDIKGDFKESPMPKREAKEPPSLKYGLIEPAHDFDPERIESWKPNRRKSEPESEAVPLEGLLLPASEVFDVPSPVVADSEADSEGPSEAVQDAGDSRPNKLTVPFLPPKAATEKVSTILPTPPRKAAPSTEPISPASPVAPVASNKPPMQSSAPPVASSQAVPVQPSAQIGTPVPQKVAGAAVAHAVKPSPALQSDEPAPKSKWAKLFGSKDPRDRIGKRVPIKRGKLQGRYGTIVSVEGDQVVISDKSGRMTTVDASDL